MTFGRTERVVTAVGIMVLLLSGVVSYYRIHDARNQAALAHDRERKVVTGKQYVIVFVGASWCRISNDPKVLKEVRQMVDSARQLARSAGVEFAFRGVAVDWDLTAGLQYLKKVGKLDEVVVGDNWLNSGVVELLMRRPGGVLATPQVLVLRRDVYAGGRELKVGPDEVLMVELGIDKLQGLAEKVSKLDWHSQSPFQMPRSDTLNRSRI